MKINGTDWNDFTKERNEALLSLNEEKIKDYCKKYNIPIPEDEEVFWAGVHKVICTAYWEDTMLVTTEQYHTSSKWLHDHGYVDIILPNKEEK